MLRFVFLIIFAMVLAGCSPLQQPAEGEDHRAEVGAPPNHLALRFANGEALRYDFRHSTGYQLTGQLPGAPSDLRIAFSAVQTHTVADLENSHARIEVSIQDVKLEQGDPALVGALESHRIVLLVAPDGLMRARHAENERRVSPPAVLAYNGVVLDPSAQRPGSSWQARLSFPIGRLLGRVVPEDHTIPVSMRYQAAHARGGELVLQYAGSADFAYRHAAEMASGKLTVSGRSRVNIETGRVLENVERAEVEAKLRMAAAEGAVHVLTTSSLRLQ